MTFYDYMMKNYGLDDSPAGDLALDMKTDSENFPRNTTGTLEEQFTVIARYLRWHNACSKCLATFEECWSEYVESMEKHSEPV